MPKMLCSGSSCSNEINPRRLSKFGTAYCAQVECQRERNRIRMRDFNADHPGYYGKYSKVNNQRYKEEAKLGLRSTKRAAHPESYRSGDAKRRAMKLGAEAENFYVREVFERDGWICGLCGETVDPQVKYPHPRSASLDHKVPLSKGGAHTRANSQCSHLSCNMAKGNREV